ncbi:hypothetical protein CVT24_011296 [Panaeolus cyanescens]|uniref:Uncharacterized protein n=1 Tax=Panaeolus cyanescens TaxID=181874 RepID=A0A409YUU4_9AGAR|nr:hypothetical protein CVT24_011296 [Panaeolus cyanescens]
MDVDSKYDLSEVPKEVLQNIFYWAVREDHFQGTRSLRMRATLARHLSHVNRKWREAALEYSELWTGPVLDWLSHPHWLETVLARSFPQPIEVIIPLDAPLRRPHVVEQALKHLSRMRTLVLDLGPVGWQVVIQKRILQHSAPLLEFCRLTLHAEGQPDSRTALLGLNKALLKAPKLQDLELVNFPFFVPRACHNLTSLVVKHMRQQSAMGIVLALESLPQLEHLIVERQPCSRKDTVPLLSNKRQYKRPIHLAKLRSLSVSSDTSFCAGILSHLKIPDRCSTILYCFDVQATSTETENLFSFMRERTDCWASDPMAGQQILDLGATLFHFRAESEFESENRSVCLELTLLWDRDAAHSPVTFDQIFHKYVSQLVEFREDPMEAGLPAALSVTVQPNLNDEYMRRLFLSTGWAASMDYITTLQLHTVHTLNIFLSFMHPPKNMDDVLFSQIMDLHLADINLSCTRLLQKLTKYLKLRNALDWNISHLKFIRCVGRLFHGGYSKIKALVGVIFINGEQDSGDDTETEDGYSSDCTVTACDIDDDY